MWLLGGYSNIGRTGEHKLINGIVSCAKALQLKPYFYTLTMRNSYDFSTFQVEAPLNLINEEENPIIRDGNSLSYKGSRAVYTPDSN